jgi:hypothetical protein
MRSLHWEVQSYKNDNERVMKSQEDMLQILNMVHKKVNKEFGTNKETIYRQVSASRSHRKSDDHENDRKSRSVRRCHHSPRRYTIRNHASLGPRRTPSVYPIQRKRIRLEADIL